MRAIKIALAGLFVIGHAAWADAASEAAKYVALPMERFRDTAAIIDDPLDTIAKIDTSKGFQVKHGLLGLVWEDSFLRAFIDKRTGKVSYQVYEIIPYNDTGWHFYQTVNYEAPGGPIDVPATIIDRNVSNCSYGSCFYIEHVAFDAPESLLRAIAATYVPGALAAWKFKFNAKSGQDFKDGLSGAEIAGCLAAVDAYLALHPIGTTTGLGVSISHETPKLGVHAMALTEANSKALRASIDHGLYVVIVDHMSAGEAAGIKAGDVIVSYQGKSVATVTDMQSAVGSSPPGSTASVEVWRDGGLVKLQAKY